MHTDALHIWPFKNIWTYKHMCQSPLHILLESSEAWWLANYAAIGGRIHTSMTSKNTPRSFINDYKIKASCIRIYNQCLRKQLVTLIETPNLINQDWRNNFPAMLLYFTSRSTWREWTAATSNERTATPATLLQTIATQDHSTATWATPTMHST